MLAITVGTRFPLLNASLLTPNTGTLFHNSMGTPLVRNIVPKLGTVILLKRKTEVVRFVLIWGRARNRAIKLLTPLVLLEVTIGILIILDMVPSTLKLKLFPMLLALTEPSIILLVFWLMYRPTYETVLTLAPLWLFPVNIWNVLLICPMLVETIMYRLLHSWVVLLTRLGPWTVLEPMSIPLVLYPSIWLKLVMAPTLFFMARGTNMDPVALIKTLANNVCFLVEVATLQNISLLVL